MGLGCLSLDGAPHGVPPVFTARWQDVGSCRCVRTWAISSALKTLDVSLFECFCVVL